MTHRILALGTALFVTACGAAPTFEENANVNNGVGFGTQQQYLSQQRAMRNAELMATRQAVPTATVMAANEEQAIAAETMTALNVAPAAAPQANGAITPLTAVGTTTASLDNPGISDEQNFDAVAGRETIESDASRLQQNRDQFVQVQPTAIPERAGAGGPNIVAYALATNHPIGSAVHRRSGNTSAERASRVCQSYGTDDQAQWAFLANGGPERDRKGVDPDGDGYACNWNPTPFRMARGG